MSRLLQTAEEVNLKRVLSACASACDVRGITGQREWLAAQGDPRNQTQREGCPTPAGARGMQAETIERLDRIRADTGSPQTRNQAGSIGDARTGG
jgi:hypothetical protein